MLFGSSGDTQLKKTPRKEEVYSNKDLPHEIYYQSVLTEEMLIDLLNNWL